MLPMTFGASILLIGILVGGVDTTSNDCPAPPPCTCDMLTIHCNNLNLTEVPPFYKPSEKTKHYLWDVRLENNLLTSIPIRAFENLTIYGLNVYNNTLTSFANDALVGSEQSLRRVNLQFNNLTEFPPALGRLHALFMLAIHHNPITDVDGALFINSSTSLQFLDIGSEAMRTWPYGIGVVKSLNFLTIYDLPMTDIPPDAFEGLENCVKSLDFENTKLRRIPAAINKLKKLSMLTLKDTIGLTDDNLKADDFTGASVTDISLTNSPITEVPNFKSVSNLTYLHIAYSRISRWSYSALPDNLIMSAVSIDHSELTEVPSVISRMDKLASVTFTNSRISSITDNFVGLRELNEITLDSNPIQNISDDGFVDNVNIRQISLRHTSLNQFPRALKSLINVRYIDLTGCVIPCTCVSMGWINHWNRSNQTWRVDGECDNIQGISLQQFIEDYVPLCPL